MAVRDTGSIQYAPGYNGDPTGGVGKTLMQLAIQKQQMDLENERLKLQQKQLKLSQEQAQFEQAQTQGAQLAEAQPMLQALARSLPTIPTPGGSVQNPGFSGPPSQAVADFANMMNRPDINNATKLAAIGTPSTQGMVGGISQRFAAEQAAPVVAAGIERLSNPKNIKDIIEGGAMAGVKPELIKARLDDFAKQQQRERTMAAIKQMPANLQAGVAQLADLAEGGAPAELVNGLAERILPQTEKAKWDLLKQKADYAQATETLRQLRLSGKTREMMAQAFGLPSIPDALVVDLLKDKDPQNQAFTLLKDFAGKVTTDITGKSTVVFTPEQASQRAEEFMQFLHPGYQLNISPKQAKTLEETQAIMNALINEPKEPLASLKRRYLQIAAQDSTLRIFTPAELDALWEETISRAGDAATFSNGIRRKLK